MLLTTFFHDLRLGTLGLLILKCFSNWSWTNHDFLYGNAGYDWWFW